MESNCTADSVSHIDDRHQAPTKCSALSHQLSTNHPTRRASVDGALRAAAAACHAMVVLQHTELDRILWGPASLVGRSRSTDAAVYIQFVSPHVVDSVVAL